MNSQTRSQRRLGVRHQVLVADLQVLAEAAGLSARAFWMRLRHLRADARPGTGSRWPRSTIALVARERDVAPVADHVDEARLGQDALDPAHPS